MSLLSKPFEKPSTSSSLRVISIKLLRECWVLEHEIFSEIVVVVFLIVFFM